MFFEILFSYKIYIYKKITIKLYSWSEKEKNDEIMTNMAEEAERQLDILSESKKEDVSNFISEKIKFNKLNFYTWFERFDFITKMNLVF